MKRIVIACLSILLFTGAGRTDWKWFGYTNTNKQNVHLFYDERGIKWLPGRIAQVWTKALDAQKVVDLKPFPALVDLAAGRLRNHYRPPIAAVQTLTQDGFINVLIWEGVADSGVLDPVNQILWEVNCNNDTSRPLSVNYTDPVRGFQSSDTPGAWIHHPPESPGSGMKKMICGG